MTHPRTWHAGTLGALLAAVMLAHAAAALAAPSDYWITTKTKVALLTAKNVSGVAIDVDTNGGVVSLHGTVPSDNDKLNAEKIAREIEGVKDVKSSLEVKPEPTRKEARTVRAERELIADVDAALKSDPNLDGGSIRVKSAAGGVVLLTGNARSLTQELQAVAIARGVDDVDGVMSEIRTPPGTDLLPEEPKAAAATAAPSRAPAKPAAPAAKAGEDRDTVDVASDAWLAAKTKTMLLKETKTLGSDINVDARRGIVSLFGTVPSHDARKSAGRIAEGVDGVERVENALEVKPAAG